MIQAACNAAQAPPSIFHTSWYSSPQWGKLGYVFNSTNGSA